MPSSVLDFHNNSSLAQYYASQPTLSSAYSKSFKNHKKSSISSCSYLHENDIFYSLFSQGYWYSAFDLSAPLRDHLSSSVNRNNLDFSVSSHSHPLCYEEFELVFSNVFTIPNLLNSIDLYLGDSGLTLYEASHFLQRRCTPAERMPTSGYWHRDPVGSHVKLFLCLHNSPNGPSTGFVPQPFLDPVTRDWEMIRTQPDTSLLEQLTELIESFSPIDIHQRTGSLLLIDTNCIHRGNYIFDISNLSLSHNDFRHLLQFSFMNNQQYALYEQTMGPLNPSKPTQIPSHDFLNLTLPSTQFVLS